MQASDMLKAIIAKKNVTIAVAESCTGGLLGGAITAVPGSSICFKGGIISYSNDVKIKILNVKEDTIREYGAVSRQCAEEMAVNVRHIFDVDISVSITGIAGPDGGTEEKPVGTVWSACADIYGVESLECVYGGDRDEIRNHAVKRAIYILYSKICKM